MKLLAIIEYTFREGLARKTIIGFFIISSFFLLLALLGAIFMPSTIDIGNAQTGQETVNIMNNEEVVRGVQAFLTGFINFAALVLSIFATASILPNTMEKGSIDLLLSKPVSRDHILFGKFIGSLLIVIVNVAYYIIGIWLIFGIRTGFWNTGFLAVTLSITFTFLVLYTPMMVIGIASRSSALTIILLYIYLFLVSPILEARQIIADLVKNDIVKQILDIIYYPLPKPDALGMLSRNLVIDQPIDWMPVWTSALFALAMYALAMLIFRRKDF